LTATLGIFRPGQIREAEALAGRKRSLADARARTELAKQTERLAAATVPHDAHHSHGIQQDDEEYLARVAQDLLAAAKTELQAR
jgi:hypothetical protein